jgi:hypothetical protein
VPIPIMEVKFMLTFVKPVPEKCRFWLKYL